MKLALIGAGNWGAKLAKNLHAMGVLGAVVEPSEINRTRIREAYPDVPLLDGVENLMHQGFQAAVIATPVPTHHSIAKKLLLDGLDVLVEKPITLTAIEAEELLSIATERKRCLMVGHLLLFESAIQWIYENLRKGVIGDLRGLHQQRLSLGRARSVENVLWSFGVHDIAVLIHLVGSSPRLAQLSCQCILRKGIEDDVYLHLEFPGGIQSHLHCSWLWPEKTRRLTIVGTQGILTYDELAQTVTLHRKSISPSLETLDQGDEVVFRGSGEPLKRELEHFLERIRDRRTPLSDGKIALEVVKTMEAAMKQAGGSHGQLL